MGRFTTCTGTALLAVAATFLVAVTMGGCRSVDITYLGVIDQHIDVATPPPAPVAAAPVQGPNGIFVDTTASATTDRGARTGSISGRVVEAGGTGVPHAMLSFVGGQPPADTEWPTFYTDVNGGFQIQGVAPGEYSLAALQNGYEIRVVDRIRVGSGRTDNVTITLNPVTGGGQ
jgi:hypothetical protein